MSRPVTNAIGTTRILYLPRIEDVNNPQMGELLGPDAVDLTCDLSDRDGLEISRNDISRDYTPWLGNHSRSIASRWRTSVSLQSDVPRQDCSPCDLHSSTPECCSAGRLYELSQYFGCYGVLVVRRGMDIDLSWAAGQTVEVLRGTWGVRNVVPLRTGPPLFSVEFHVVEEAGFDGRDRRRAAGTTQIVPGRVPLPCGVRLCLGDSCNSPYLACTDDDGEELCLLNEACLTPLTDETYETTSPGE